MQIRQKRVVSCFEVVLLILSSFAIAFILEQNLVSGQVANTPTLASPFDPVKIIDGKVQSAVFTGGEEAWINPTTGQIFGADGSLKGMIGENNALVQPGAEGEGSLTSDITTGIKGLFSGKFNLGLSGELGIHVGALFAGLAWAGVAYGAVQLIGNLLGLKQDLTNALSYAAAGGFGTGAYLQLSGLSKSIGSLVNLPAGATTFIIGATIATVIFVLTYKKEKKKLISFECLPFEPPLGGAKCEECNKDPFRPCSEYRCRSLGQACQLLNPGTAEERCAWVSPKDAVSPIIEPWKDALKPAGLQYVPDNSIRPPNRGVKVITQNKNGCLQAFTPLEFGITTNEPAQCKIDYNHTGKFDNMFYYMGGSNYYRYNHTEKLKLPGPESNTDGVAPELKNDGFFSLFVRCRDANGNANVDEFVFNFCVDPSADTTPPIIEGTSIISGSPIRNDAEQVPIQVYVNEPAECRWSRTSKSYEDMENSMECATETFQINADLNYVCSSNLTITEKGAGTENKFYFRCKDQPNKPESERNVMIQSHELVLKGSQKLNIIETKPNETIFGSTDVVKVNLEVKTDDGAEEGKAICYFSDTGDKDSYIAMFETNSFMHKQILDLIGGNYKFYFRCIDKGGNTAEATTAFSVFIDKSAPIVTRAYKEEGLKIVTNEDAECVYSLNSCNYEFSEGLPLIYSNPSLKRNHFAEWKPNGIYYIKCKDLYENKPSPNECSIVASAVELGGKK